MLGDAARDVGVLARGGSWRRCGGTRPPRSAGHRPSPARARAGRARAARPSRPASRSFATSGSAAGKSGSRLERSRSLALRVTVPALRSCSTIAAALPPAGAGSGSRRRQGSRALPARPSIAPLARASSPRPREAIRTLRWPGPQRPRHGRPQPRSGLRPRPPPRSGAGSCSQFPTVQGRSGLKAAVRVSGLSPNMTGAHGCPRPRRSQPQTAINPPQTPPTPHP